MILEKEKYTDNFNDIKEKIKRTELSDDIIRRASVVDFRIVDPPYTPVKPSSPNRFFF
jgi:uncharacterized protein involved in exopolysaccharide biosynthesis